MATNVTDKRRLPWVAAAFFCERVIQETDGVLTIIRIVDTVFVQQLQPIGRLLPEGALAAEQHPFSGLQIVVILKSGEYRGSGAVTFKAIRPNGEELVAKTAAEVNVELKGGANGVNVIVKFGAPFPESGIYWFDVYFEDTLLTRMPLSVVLSEPMTETAAPAAPEQQTPPPRGRKSGSARSLRRPKS